MYCQKSKYEIKYYNESVVMLQHPFSKANVLSLTLFPLVSCSGSSKSGSCSSGGGGGSSSSSSSSSGGGSSKIK